MGREFSYLKRDTLERKLVGEIIARFEKAGLSIVKMRKGRISPKLADLLYEDSEEQLNGMGGKTLSSLSEKEVMGIFGTTKPYEIGKQLNSWNKKTATSTEVIAMVLEGPGDDVPARVRTLIGKTDPSKADKGTIRGDYADDSIYKATVEKRSCRNLVHASDPARAELEIKLFEENFF